MPIVSVQALLPAAIVSRSLHRPRRALVAAVIVLINLLVPAVRAQDANASDVMQMTQVSNEVAGIELDGFLNEAVWQTLPAFDGMRVINPDTLAPASLPTESRIFYNQRGIYVGVMNFQSPETLVARMSSRDDGVQRDGYVISIDASGEGLYGYYLRVNLGGTLSDGTILPEKQISRDWDGPWQAETRELDNGWSAEIFIPWSMMALPDRGDTRHIGIYTERMFAAENETWSWPALPSTNPQYLSAFQTFELRGVSPVPSSRSTPTLRQHTTTLPVIPKAGSVPTCTGDPTPIPSCPRH